MEGRRLLGAVLLLGGLVLVGVGVAGLLGSGSGSAIGPSPAPSTAPASAVQPTPAGSVAASLVPTSPAPVSAAPPSVAPTADPLALVRAFFVRLEAAVREGNQGSMVASLGGAVIDRYGISTCEATLASRQPSPEQRFEILSISGPAPWEYVTDGLTTTIPDAYTVPARVAGPDASGVVSTRDAELHVTIADGMVFWYTDCGEPLPG